VIEKFLAKPKKVKICGEELDIYPLKVKDLDVVMKLSNKDNPEGLREMLERSLKKTFPDEVDKIPDISIEFLEPFVNAIMEVNNIEITEEQKKKAIESLK